MNKRKPKTLEDFPRFKVLAVRRGETSAKGDSEFEIDGRLDGSVENIDQHWFWLLIRDNDCVCANLKSLDRETKIATVTCDEVGKPIVAGQTLFYLSPYWQAFNVWMVLNPNWGWKRTQFEAVDAIAQDYQAEDVSIVRGREVRIWTKLERADKTGHESRHYPAYDQNAPPNLTLRTIPGGWGHEHCDLCKSHINGGDFGYRDPGARWMCQKCYQAYVVPRDLSFVDEL
jgi:hypothetical protein